MFSKLRRSKSEAAAHEPPKKQNVLRGMPALKLLRKSKKENADVVAKPFNTSLTTLTESERLGLPPREAEMKYIGPKSHLEEESAPDSHNLNGNLNSRMSNTPTNMNNLRERHKVVVGKVGDINNIDRFKGMSFEQKESLMYYNEIISTKPAEQNIDNSYLTPTSNTRTKPKKDARKGHGLHSVKKRRRESREAHKDMIALTPKERESILFLDGILKLEEESFTATHTDENEEDDGVSQTSSTGSIIDMVGDLKSLTPSPNIKHKEKTFAMPKAEIVAPPLSTTGAVEVMTDKLEVQKPKKHKKRDKEKRRKRSKERETRPEGEGSENREKRERRKERSKKTQEPKPAGVNGEKTTDNLQIKERQSSRNTNKENEEIKPTVSQQEISEITANLRIVDVNKTNESFEEKPKPSKRSKPKEEAKEERQHRSKRTNGERKNKVLKSNSDDQRRRHGNNSRIDHEDRETAPSKHIVLDDNGNLKHSSKSTTQQIKPRQKSSEERRKHRKERGEKSKRKSRNLESETNSDKPYSITTQRATDIN